MVVTSLQDKCHQYWPDQGCWTYGNVRVAVEDFTVLVDYTIRKFCIQYVSFKEYCVVFIRNW